MRAAAVGSPGRGVLRYVLDREYLVGGVRLSPGDVTEALFWEDRPYTLYLWRTRDRGSVYYFNIADSVSLCAEKFVWRDLVIDILVEPGQEPRILDEDELPHDLPSCLQAYIQSATRRLLASYDAVIQEAQFIINGIQQSGQVPPMNTSLQ